MGDLFFCFAFPLHPPTARLWGLRVVLVCLGWASLFGLFGCLNQGGQCRSNHACEKGFACFRGVCLRNQSVVEAPPPEIPDAHTSETSEPLPEDASSTIDAEPPSETPPSENTPPESLAEISPESYTPPLPWIRFLRATQSIAITDQQRHPNGDIFVGGWFRGKQAHFAGLSVTDVDENNRQAFLLRLSPSGSARWVKIWGAEGNESLTSIAISPQAEIYILGTFTSALLSIGSSRFAQKGETSSFLAKINEDGEVLWARSAGGDGNAFASALAIGEDNALYVAGQMYGKDIQLFDDRLYTTPPAAIGYGTDFLSRLDRDGKYRWTLAYGTSAQGVIFPKIAVAPSTASTPPTTSPIYITHRFLMMLPAPSIKSTGLRSIVDAQDPYVMLVQPDGQPLWADLFYALKGDETPQTILATNAGVFLAGTYRGELFSSEHISQCSSAQYSGFIGHWDTKGILRWTQTITATSATSTAQIQSIAHTPQALYLLGDIQGDIHLPNAVTPHHKAQDIGDIFLAELDFQGRWRTLRTLHGTKPIHAQGRLLADPNGAFVFSGITDSPVIVWGTSRFPIPHNTAEYATAFVLHTERTKP